MALPRLIALLDWLAAPAFPSIAPKAPTGTPPMKLRDLVTAKRSTALAVANDQSKLAADQATVADDQAKLATDTAADVAADKAVSDFLGTNGLQLAVDPTPNADGTFNVLVKDTSPTGYHVVAAPSLDADLPA